ncbi:MAG TPA: hypothetical protein VK053_19275 [Jiangellaceae bacterium]|nr:hypothetical protein [Jiangellaceae bacterium]
MTQHAFPDIEMALVELLEPHGETRLRLDAGFEQRIDEGEAPAVIHAMTLGGYGGNQILRTDRARVGVYAASRDGAHDLAMTIRAHLLDSPHVTEAGLLDLVTCETEPVQVPYPSDRVLLWQATFRVDTRPVPSIQEGTSA